MDATLDAQELAMVEIGLQQIESGKVMPHEEVRKRMEEMLRKRQQ